MVPHKGVNFLLQVCRIVLIAIPFLVIGNDLITANTYCYVALLSSSFITYNFFMVRLYQFHFPVLLQTLVLNVFIHPLYIQDIYMHSQIILFFRFLNCVFI